MRAALVLLAACGGSDGVGVVAFTDPAGQVATVDVASGVVAVIDPGEFGGIAIAPDGKHVAYVGNDGVPKVNDLAGNIAMLHGGDPGGTLRWLGDALTYESYHADTGVLTTELVASLGASARSIDGHLLAISHDGAHVAYLSTPLQQVVLEDLDGGNQVVVGSNTADVFVFSDDDPALIYSEPTDNKFQVTRYDLAAGTRTPLGPGFIVPPLPGGSSLSPDGREVLADDQTNALVGYSIDDSAKHVYIPGRVATGFLSGVAYLDNGRALADLGGLLQLTDGTKSRMVASNDGQGCGAIEVSRALRQIMVTCSTAAIVDFDGALLISRAAPTAIAMTSDGGGLISLDSNGDLELTTPHGTRALAQTMPPGNAFVSAPFAAYAP